MAAGVGTAATRLVFRSGGADVYAWEQSLDEVLVFFTPPPGAPAAAFACTITATRVTLGLKGAPPFLDEPLAAACAARESFWNLEPGELTLTLTKARKGETWPCVFVGHGALDAAAEADVHRRALGAAAARGARGGEGGGGAARLTSPLCAHPAHPIPPLYRHAARALWRGAPRVRLLAGGSERHRAGSANVYGRRVVQVGRSPAP
jgi:hypothetical protein